MDFGKVADYDLHKVNFTLPSGPEGNAAILAKGDGTFDFRLGSQKWGRKEWVGQIYPEGTKEQKFLAEYVKKFNYLEMSQTFYQIPRPEQLRQWGQLTEGHDIRFNIKVSQSISHMKRFWNCDTELDAFFDAISQFGPNLGRVWMQVSDNFGSNNFEKVLDTFRNLPTTYRYFIEFRHPQIFESQVAFKEITDFLTEQRIGLIITDTAGRRDVAHMALTVPEAMIRFMGHNDPVIDTPRIKQWAERLSEWRQQGLEKVFFSYDQTDYGSFPRDFQRAKDIFEAAGLFSPTIQ